MCKYIMECLWAYECNHKDLPECCSIAREKDEIVSGVEEMMQEAVQ